MDNIEKQELSIEKNLRFDSSPEINIPQESLLQIILRRNWIILLTVGTCLVGMFVYLYKATPIYTSTAFVWVQQSGPTIITPQEGFMTQTNNYLYAQCGLIKSTPIISAVINRPEFASMKTFGPNVHKINYLKKELDVSVGKKDDIISISFDSPYPVEAAQLVNEVVTEYTIYHADRIKDTAEGIRNLLQVEMDIRDNALKEKYEEILVYREENQDYFIEGAKSKIQVLKRWEAALADAISLTISAKEDYKAAQLLSDDPDKLRQFVEARYTSRGYYSGNQEQLQLRNELNQLQQQKLGLANKVNPEHPAMKSIESKISQVENRISDLNQKMTSAYLEVTRQQWVAAQQNEQEMQTKVDEQTILAQEEDLKAYRLVVLQAELNSLQATRDSLDDRIKQINPTENVGALNIEVMEYAEVAEDPSKPNKPRFMAIALVIGLLLGVGLVLMLDWMDTRLRSADDISATLGVPVLGTIPSMRNRKDIVSCGQAVHQESTSFIAEAYKTVRTAVYFGVPDGQAKSLLVTSPSAGDGKSTLVSNLATAMAQAGQRTLVIDCDFRKPMQHTIFGLEREPGISSVLTGQEVLENAIKSSEEKNLDILTCGPIPVNPSELLNSQAFNDIIEKLSEKYDRLLIDSPPVMPVADARILGAVSDVTLVVLRAEKSTRKTSEQARDGLLSVGTNILGAVVNDVHHRKGRYGYYKGYRYGYYGYGYGYGHSGREKGDREKKGGREPAVVN